MKIVHIAYAHRYDDIRIYEKECKSLKEQGHNVFYITSNKIAETDDIKSLEVTVKILKLDNRNRFMTVLRYLKAAEKEVDSISPDVCHLHDWQLLPLIPKFKNKYKVIFDSHEDFPAYLSADLMPKLPRTIKEKVFFEIEKFYLKNATWLIAANDHIKMELTKITSHVTAIKNYPIIYDDNVSNHYLPQFCYIGGISDNLGGEVIAEAVRDVDSKIILVGNTDLGYLAKISELANNKIEYLGFKSKAEVRNLIKNSIGGLVVYLPHPNCIHALPNKMFEYLESRVPIICSDFDDWKNMLKDKGCCIFVDPSNVKEIQSAMDFLISNPDKAKIMGENGRKAVENEFNWKIEKEKLQLLYNELESHG